MNDPAPTPNTCCDHAVDAAKWRRVEYSIERAARKGYDLNPEDLLETANGE